MLGPGHLGLGLGQRLLQLARIDRVEQLPFLTGPLGEVHRLEEARDTHADYDVRVSERLADPLLHDRDVALDDVGYDDIRRGPGQRSAF